MSRDFTCKHQSQDETGILCTACPDRVYKCGHYGKEIKCRTYLETLKVDLVKAGFIRKESPVFIGLRGWKKLCPKTQV